MRERTRVGYGLRYRGRDIPLLKREIVIGRSASCDLVLDSQLVSRRHALVRLGDERPSVSDLGSSNGVLVNGRLVDAETPLAIGDQISIGEEMLEVVQQRLARERERITAQNLRARKAPGSPAPPTPVDEPRAERTRRADAFTLLGGLVDNALVLGRGEEAERLLSGHLARILDEARAGVGRDRQVAATAAGYAAKLAAATGKSSWIDYIVRLYRALEEPLPIPVIDEMYGLLRHLRGYDRAMLREYLAMLRGRVAQMSRADRFALQRIESLERLAAL